MKEITTNKILLLAIVAGLFFHLLALMFSFQNSYDAFVHMFFADHYMRSWFEPWEPRWYTGFMLFSYPPLVHQHIALWAYSMGLKGAFILTGVLGVIMFTTGFFRFSSYLTQSRKAGAYATLLAVFSTAIIESLHLFGQMPMLWGISLLLHALAEIYLWFRYGRIRNFLLSLLILAVLMASHHVTAIFGMVFFILPMIALAFQDTLISEGRVLHLKNIVSAVWQNRIRLIVFGISALAILILVIFPYWQWSQSNPITQTSIPHGSRSNFLQETNFGMVFFLIPWGTLIILLGYYIYRFASKRLMFFGISFAFLFVLGLGGTTPIAQAILGKYVFNILTLERFTFWAVMIALPLAGEFAHSFYYGNIGKKWKQSMGLMSYRFWRSSFLIMYLAAALITVMLFRYSPVQPENIETKPIVNFLNQDEHDQWRYITLGFGDQMAWLSTQTTAKTLDGNYHSARAVPELTTRPVERIENLKYSGNIGIQALEDILSTAEQYHLKYCFSNDKFYDPILFYNGWQRIGRLDNGIVVWERPQISKLPHILPREASAQIHKLLWGIVPLGLFIAFLLFYFIPLLRRQIPNKKELNTEMYTHLKPNKVSTRLILASMTFIFVALSVITMVFGYHQVSQHSPEHTLDSYFTNVDLKNFKQAHSYFFPSDDFSLEQYMLEIQTKDGLLNSYSKLNSVKYKVLEEKEGYRKIMASSVWQTPLNWIEKNDIFRLRYTSGKWYILSEKYSTDIPEDPFFTGKSVNFYNHGRRENTITKNNFIESMDQPDLELLQYTVVKQDSIYSLQGMIKNTSNRPANIWVNLKIYENHTLHSEHHTNRLVKYLLLPGETTPFSLELKDLNNIQGKSLSLFLSSEVSYKGLYPYANVLLTEDEDAHKKLTIYNYGTQEITIPRLLLALRDSSGRLVQVREHIPLHSIRPQRKLTEDIDLQIPTDIQVLDVNLDNILINNMPTPYSPKMWSSARIEAYLNPFIGVLS